MVNVEVVCDFFVESTSSHYVTGYKGEVSNELAKRHGSDGTGFLKEVDVLPDPEPVTLRKASTKK